VSALTLLLVALGVSADAFAVAVGQGLQLRRLELRTAAAIALSFGAFQGVMPLIGWALGRQLERWITAYDHWVAFALLVGVGLKMLHEAVTARDDEPARALSPGRLLVLSVATSIDALAVGVGFAFLPVDIVPAALVIGATTTVLSFAGVVLGSRAGARWRGPAEVAGGVVLVLIGFRVLLDHLGVL
jgi:putative Mn2+ efflux pump MntP